MKLTNCSIRQFAALVSKLRRMQERPTTKLATKYSGNYSWVLLGALALAGCAAAPTVEVQKINIAIPVECREPTPARPVMPTEALAPGVAPFELLRAALAEIDRREGYEVRLRAALDACTRPARD